MSLTRLLGTTHSLHPDSSMTFSYVMRNSNQVKVSLPGNTLYLISCCSHVVGFLSLQFLFTVRYLCHIMSKAEGFREKAVWAPHGRADSNMWYYFRELKSPDTWRGGDMTGCGNVKGDYSWRLWNVSSANQIKSWIIPGAKEELLLHVSHIQYHHPPTPHPRAKMSFLMVNGKVHLLLLQSKDFSFIYLLFNDDGHIIRIFRKW